MTRCTAIGLLLGVLSVTCGCASGLIALGAAAGGGAAYIAGEDTRVYEAEYSQAVQACLETLRTLKIPVSERQSDELKTTLQARRADDTPVRVRVERKGPGRTQIGVRTGTLGLSDLTASEQIHAALGARLGRSAPGAEASTTRDPGQKEKAEERSEPQFVAGTSPELSIYLAADSNELRPGETEKLDRVVETVKLRPQARITLAGYTDSIGADDYNLMIAESRASTVKLYLVAKGVEPHRVTVVGKGGRDFVAGNERESGRRLNRRVEITISEAP